MLGRYEDQLVGYHFVRSDKICFMIRANFDGP